MIAILLATLVVVGPIVNTKGRPPRAVFLVLPQSATPPEVRIETRTIGDGRYLLMLHTSDFVFTELCVVDAEALPIGHAHVHVNGVKVASAFTPMIEIGPLEPGAHSIDVVLRGQDHRPIIAENGLVQDRIRIEVPGEAG